MLKWRKHRKSCYFSAFDGNREQRWRTMAKALWCLAGIQEDHQAADKPQFCG